MNLEKIDIKHLIENLKKYRIWVVLIGIFLMGFGIRYLAHGPRLAALDPWFQYRMVEYILTQGRPPDIDPLAYYPDGRDIWRGDYLFLPYFIALTYRLIFQHFGISVIEYMIAFPAIMGGLACVVMYFIGKELFDEKVGFLSAILYTSLPAATSRVYAGFADKEGLAGFLIFVWAYLFLKSYKLDLNNKRNLIYPVFAGIFFGASCATWSGGNYTALLIFFSSAIYLAYKRDTGLMKTITIMAPIGLLFMWLFQPLRFPLLMMIFNTSYVGLLFISFLYLVFSVSRYLEKRMNNAIPSLYIYSSFFAVFVIGAFFFGMQDKVTGAVKGMFELVTRVLTFQESVQADIYMGTVAESQPTYFFGGGETIIQRIINGDWYGYLNATLFIFPIGIIFIIDRMKKRRDYASIFALVWIVSGVVAMKGGQRLNYFLGPPAVIFTSYAFISILNKLKNKENRLRDVLKQGAKPVIKIKAERSLSNIKLMYIFFIFLLLLVTFSTIVQGIAVMDGRRSDVPKPWYDAMMWIKDNTPENSVMFSWWDYGYWFQALAERYTIADGGGNVPRNKDLAKMFTSPENESMKYIRKYVDYEKVPTYMLVSYEEFGKSGAINRIGQDELFITSFSVPATGNLTQDQNNLAEIFARNGITTYYVLRSGNSYQVWALIQVDNQGRYHPEWGDKLLAKLLPFNTGLGQGLEHFELVYPEDPVPFNYIFIYKVK